MTKSYVFNDFALWKQQSIEWARAKKQYQQQSDACACNAWRALYFYYEKSSNQHNRQFWHMPQKVTNSMCAHAVDNGDTVISCIASVSVCCVLTLNAANLESHVRDRSRMRYKYCYNCVCLHIERIVITLYIFFWIYYCCWRSDHAQLQRRHFSHLVALKLIASICVDIANTHNDTIKSEFI